MSVNMRILWLCALFHYALAQPGFGTSYLRNSRLCHQWNCLNVKLGLPDLLPPREQYTTAIKPLLHSEWHDVADTALDVCYRNRTRRYTNTCPGQALMHCVVDNLIANCPDDKWQKEDGCAQVSSLADNKYMFSQSRYANLQKNLESERRPAWFLQHYFSTKCCQVPDLFNATVLSECGFESFMFYHWHDAQTDSHKKSNRFSGISSNKLRANLSPNLQKMRDKENGADALKKEKIKAINDPLDCCELGEFIAPRWRSECGFHLSWKLPERLVINENLNSVTEQHTTTEAGNVKKVVKTDVKIVPLSCEQETCIFSKLGVVLESGMVDRLALSRLLDNMTAAEPAWTRAKARVDTKCLTPPNLVYEAECEINKVLSCTLDVLTENCPDAKKEDPCKHSRGTQNNLTCQISSSKYRPRNRRQLCNVPDFVEYKILKECGVESITRLEYAPVAPAPKLGWSDDRKCIGETPSTTCIMRKMGVLNTYNFIDYFKMKDNLRDFCQGEWYPMKTAYTTAFSSALFYKEHCSSQQKLLNVLDVMLTTCPISKRRHSAHCTQMYTDLFASIPGYHPKSNNVTVEELLRQNHGVLSGQGSRLKYPPKERTIDYPRYNFNFGLLSSKDEPLVRLIDVKPTSLLKLEQKPLVLLPVYQLMKQKPTTQTTPIL